MFSRKTAVVLGLLPILLVAAVSVSVFADDSDAAFDVKVADMGGDDLKVKAGSSLSFNVVITNNAAYDAESVAEDIIVTMTAEVKDGSGHSVSGVSATVAIKGDTDGYAILSGQQMATFVITVEPGRYTDKGDYTLVYTYTVADLDNVPLGDPVTLENGLEVESYTDSEGYYNKFLGMFQNDMDGTFGESWFTAVVSCIAFILIGAAISLVAAPVVSALISTKDSPNRSTLRRSLTHTFLLIAVVFAVSRSLAIYGIEEEDYELVTDVYILIYALVLAYIVWKVYSAFLDRVASGIKAHGSPDAFDNYQSFKPLFLYLGKIIIALVTVFSVMGIFGIDMAAIITSAGLITLGITFGAQQILSQFFAGLLILTTRPFKKGDLIQLGTNVVYKVRKVNVMNTELENWDNSDITMVPNNTLTGSSVKNLTRDTLRTKLYVFISVGYGTDLDLARKLMVEAAMEHPHIIKDGPVPAPSTSLMDFQDSNIQLRLNIWIDDFNLIIKVGSDMRASMFEKFKAAGISIDYNQIVVRSADSE